MNFEWYVWVQEGRDRLWRHYPEGEMSVSDVRLLSDAVAMPMRSAAGSHFRAYHASPPRKPHQNHHHQQQQQQQVPAKADTEERIIQPKTTATTTTPAAATTTGQNLNVRRANAIDRYSRVVFPVIFTVFSIMYWAIYINASSNAVNLDGFVVDWATSHAVQLRPPHYTNDMSSFLAIYHRRRSEWQNAYSIHVGLPR